MDATAKPKWIPYYWNCAKHFGEGCYRAWREELFSAILFTIVAYLLSKGTDPRAWNDLQVAFTASGAVLGLFAVYHLARAPFLAHAEAMAGDGHDAVPVRYGLFGILVFLGLIAGGLGLGRYIYAALPRAQIQMVIKAPAMPTVVVQSTPPQKNLQDVRTRPTPALPTILPPVQPATQLDRLIAINGRMTTSDREQFSDVLHDFSQILDQADMLGLRLSQEGAKINQGVQSGTIAREIDAHKTTLLQISSSARDFARIFPQEREKGKYYMEQTSYIFGDNPDNDGPSAIINASEGYANYLDRWATIQNKDQRPVLDLLGTEQNEFNRYLRTFFGWQRDSERRLGQMRDSIR